VYKCVLGITYALYEKNHLACQLTKNEHENNYPVSTLQSKAIQHQLDYRQFTTILSIKLFVFRKFYVHVHVCLSGYYNNVKFRINHTVRFN